MRSKGNAIRGLPVRIADNASPSGSKEKTPKLFWRVVELVEATGLSERTIRRDIESGRLPARRREGTILIPHESVVAWLDSWERVG